MHANREKIERVNREIGDQVELSNRKGAAQGQRSGAFLGRLAYYRQRDCLGKNVTLAGIALNVRSLAFSQPCFCIYIYSNVLDAEAAPGLLVDPSVVAASFPRLPRNIWGDPLVSWYALSYAKADVAALHLAKRERLIWIDVDTLITRNLQDAYLRLSSFVVLDSKTNKSYGDLWMLDDHVVAAVRAVQADLTVQLPYDLQSIFDILMEKQHNATGLHNLPRVLEPACWGFDFASNGHPYPINSSLYLKHLLGSKEFLGNGKNGWRRWDTDVCTACHWEEQAQCQ